MHKVYIFRADLHQLLQAEDMTTRRVIVLVLAGHLAHAAMLLRSGLEKSRGQASIEQDCVHKETRLPGPRLHASKSFHALLSGVQLCICRENLRICLSAQPRIVGLCSSSSCSGAQAEVMLVVLPQFEPSGNMFISTADFQDLVWLRVGFSQERAHARLGNS